MLHSILQSRWFTAVAVVLVGFLAISLIRIEPALVATNKELKSLDKKMAEIEKSALELQRLGSYFNSDAYLERQARLKLNYKKPDESVVYVYGKETKMAEASKAEKPVSKIFENKFAINLKSWLSYLIK